jgi:hypothetical protein
VNLSRKVKKVLKAAFFRQKTIKYELSAAPNDPADS